MKNNRTAERAGGCCFVLLAASFVLLSGGCGGRSLAVLVVTASRQEASYSEIERAAADWGADSDADVTVAAPRSPSASEQQRTLEAHLGKKWDIICIEPLSAAAISPLLEYAQDRGSVVVTLRGGSFPAADHNVEPFSSEEMGERMMEALSRAGAVRSGGAYVTLLPPDAPPYMRDIENAAVRVQKRRYGGMTSAGRLVETGPRAEEAVRRHMERYAIRGALFFAAADGLAASRANDGGGDRRVAVVGLAGLAELRNSAELRDAVKTGRIGRLFCWSERSLVLAGLELGRAAARGRRFGAREPLSLNIPGYETLRHTGEKTWTARDIQSEIQSEIQSAEEGVSH
jgi:ABC-type sugar transport system substrate-binding protein